MDSNFFQNKEMHYNELGVVLEDFNYTKKAKVYIGVLLPEIQGNSPINNKIVRGSTSNILNKTGSQGITSAQVSNYVELLVPRYIGETLKNDRDIIKKGTQLLISFIGGEINKPVVVGVVNPEDTFNEGGEEA